MIPGSPKSEGDSIDYFQSENENRNQTTTTTKKQTKKRKIVQDFVTRLLSVKSVRDYVTQMWQSHAYAMVLPITIF